jgi:hypothetical protein
VSDTIRNILFRAARAECEAALTVADGYCAGGLDSGAMEIVTGEAFGIFKERNLPDVTEAAPEAADDEAYTFYGYPYLSSLADRALAALDALDTIIETTDRRDLLEQEFIKIRALIEELAPQEVPVVPAPDVVPVQEPLAFPDAVK